MKLPESPSAAIPPHDYRLALKSAVSWLGDRYLLADPLPRRTDWRKTHFNESRRGFDTRNGKRHSTATAAR
ncbi:MAG: hypothetical protein ABI769_15985 [Pseudomonadota bacterium]